MAETEQLGRAPDSDLAHSTRRSIKEAVAISEHRRIGLYAQRFPGKDN